MVLFLFRIKNYCDHAPEGSATLKWPAITALKSASSCAYQAARLASAASAIRELAAVIFIWAYSQLMLGVEEIRVLANETRDDKPRSKMPRIGGRLRKASSNGVQARL